MRLRLIWRWYDLWVGAYVDRALRRVYVGILPTVLVVLDFGHGRNPLTPWTFRPWRANLPHSGIVSGETEPRQEYAADADGEAKLDHDRHAAADGIVTEGCHRNCGEPAEVRCAGCSMGFCREHCRASSPAGRLCYRCSIRRIGDRGREVGPA